MVGFIFGGGKDAPWTYEELQNKRKMAEALAASNLAAPKNVGEGLNAIGRALMYRNINKKAGAEESRMRDEFNAKWGSVFGGYGGGNAAASGGGARSTPSGTWTPNAPAPDAVDIATQGADVAKKGGLSFGDVPKADPGVIGAGREPLDFGAAVMTPQQMIIEGAKMRGLDPIDVATAISYETGGRFDPMIAGPTTQWGTHRGLIQFGEPQAQQHGVDFSSPDAAWRSQLNPESGAVWNYLEGAGVRPGMGLPEVYSAINAGSVGRMGASDANNGGAPGTVADKVASMGPHRQKAAQFLGGTWTPAEGGGQVTYSSSGGGQGGAPGFSGGMDIGALVGLASDPMASPAQKAIIETLIQQQLQSADPLRAIQLEKERLELEQMRNPEAEKTDYDIRAAEATQYGLEPGTPEHQVFVLTGKLPDNGGGQATEYGTTLQFYTDPKDGKLKAGVIGKDGTFKEVAPPDGGDWASGVDKVDAGTKWVFIDKRTGNIISEQEKDLRGAETEKAIGQAEGEAAGDAVTGLGNALAKGEQALGLIDQIANDPALPSILGIVQGNIPAGTPVVGGGQAGADLGAKIEQLQGQVFLEAFESLKGAGQITEIEGQKAERAKARLQRSQSPEAYREALNELREVIEGGMARAKGKAAKANDGGNPEELSDEDLLNMYGGE